MSQAEESLTEALASYLLIVCGSFAAAIVLWRFIRHSTALVRTVVSLGNSKQRYFAIASPRLEAFKVHLLWAPISRKRHNREIQLSPAINVGTLPTRLQLLFIVGYFATNIAFCIIDIPYTKSYVAAATMLRNRSGVLCLVNMVRVSFPSLLLLILPISFPLKPGWFKRRFRCFSWPGVIIRCCLCLLSHLTPSTSCTDGLGVLSSLRQSLT
jgi:hypothetical protein